MRIRDKLTFANVIACLALFIALGGVGYAATQLPKNSVGSRQLKPGAVTPPKLSAAAKKVLTAAGAPGPEGREGPPGKPGPEGREGPQGPGAVSFEIPAPAVAADVKVIDGVRINAQCNATQAVIGLLPEPMGATLRLAGTVWFAGNVLPIYEKSGGGFYGPVNTPIVFDLIARNESSGAPYQHFHVALDSPACEVRGFVTPSTAG